MTHVLASEGGYQAFHLGGTERALNNLIRAFAKVDVTVDPADAPRGS